MLCSHLASQTLVGAHSTLQQEFTYHSPISLIRWGSQALHRDSTRLKPSSSKLSLSWWKLSVQRLEAMADLILVPQQEEPFLDIFFTSFSGSLMSDNPHSARIPCLECWTVSWGYLSREVRNHPLPPIAGHITPASRGWEKLRVKPVEILERIYHKHYLWLSTAPETHVLQYYHSAQTTKFLKAAYRIAAWLILLHLRDYGPQC